MKRPYMKFKIFFIFFTSIQFLFASEVNPPTPGFQAYKPTYLLKNSNSHYFSVSAKYPFWYNPNGSPERHDNFYFAYSQKAIWIPSDTSGNDENYLYTNYNPELFYIYDFRNEKKIPLTLQFGFEHESDGLGKQFDKQHHEWDRFYFNPSYMLFNDELKLSFKIWYASLDLKYNPDIINYMGFTEFKISTTYFKKLYQPKIELTLRKGATNKLDDFTFIFEHHLALFTLLKNDHSTAFNFYTRAFYGYGDFLRSYKRKSKSLRFGVSYDF